jgi:hypothetical protein
MLVVMVVMTVVMVVDMVVVMAVVTLPLHLAEMAALVAVRLAQTPLVLKGLLET